MATANHDQDDFNPGDEPDENSTAPPAIPDPEAGSIPEGGDAPGDPALLTLGDDVAEMKAADAPPESDDQPPTIEPQDFSQPRQSFGKDVADIVASDREIPEREAGSDLGLPPRSKTPLADTPATPVRDDGDGAIPQSFEDFHKSVADLKRADGRPWDKRAVANLYRRYKELGYDNGMEAPPGQEYLEAESRQGERLFHQQDKVRFQATTDLLKLLTQVSIEEMRELTMLKDALLRNRH